MSLEKNVEQTNQRSEQASFANHDLQVGGGAMSAIRGGENSQAQLSKHGFPELSLSGHGGERSHQGEQKMAAGNGQTATTIGDAIAELSNGGLTNAEIQKHLAEHARKTR